MFTPSHRGGAGSPLVLVHGFTDTWRTWELVLPALEAEHDVLAVTMPGHAGGAALSHGLTETVLVEAVEAAMDEAGFSEAHVVGNSLGGYVSLQLASRGRASSVVALAPAGGWGEGDTTFRDTLAYFPQMHGMVKAIAPQADVFMASPEGRRRATAMITTNYEHLPAELIAHQLRGVAACTMVEPLVAFAAESEWELDLAAIDCPVRFVWGTDDKLLPWPTAAARYREGLPQADWVELDGIGHCPQLDVPTECAELILGFTRA